ncbi:hypothetical protein [Paenibacillus radicis (ex Xue et al. 2023)]|uniref:Uncharacterized protein n=1 Tax=Paenibacillus radicis (ex Xue et al. 2023) TaxID=2972489 RepID=A0ABT1YS70_9BACL|nr:hypothetical protein [Paenibacillus radicis (ex Xue et al. 2023)]MCR8636032.1 hypothetical protein [Paenibacillus radicis (ex Xue et al. 2023)]
MERLLVKAGIYGFIVGLFLAILFCTDTVTTQPGRGFYSSEALPMREYILTLLRFAIKLSLGTVVAVWVYERFLRTPDDEPEPSFWSGFFKAFFIVLALIMVGTLLFSVIGQRR